MSRLPSAAVLAARRSGRVELAVLALLALDGSGPDERRKLAQVAAGWELPRKFLASVLTVLAANGIIASGRGHTGGYWLVRPLSAIALIDVLAALGPPSEGGGPDAAGSVWAIIDRHVCDALGAVTVADVGADLLAGHGR